MSQGVATFGYTPRIDQAYGPACTGAGHSEIVGMAAQRLECRLADRHVDAFGQMELTLAHHHALDFHAALGRPVIAHHHGIRAGVLRDALAYGGQPLGQLVRIDDVFPLSLPSPQELL